jgi:hypothetical protein
VRRAGGVGPLLPNVGERDGPCVDVERSAGDLPGERRAVDVFPSLAGAELAERLQARVERSPRPMPSKLTPAGQRRLQVLLEQMPDPHQA